MKLNIMKNRKFLLMLYITIAIIILMAISICILYNKGEETQVGLIINEEEIQFKNREIDEKNLTMLDIEKNLTIKNTTNSIIYVQGKKVKPQNSINVKIDKIARDSKISIGIKFKGNIIYTNYNINTIPNEFPEWKTSGESKYKGYYYTNINNLEYHYLVKINEKGEILFYKKTDTYCYQFKQVKNDDKIRYTYLNSGVANETNNNEEKTTSESTWRLVVLDENYHEIDRRGYKLKDGKEVGIDEHEAFYIEDNHYILVTYQDKYINNLPEEIGYGTDILVQNCLIEEIKDEEILWQFESADYPDLYKYVNTKGVLVLKPSKNYYCNYTHFNSFAIDKTDGNLLVCFRNLNAIIKIDRNTGEKIWILGGIGDEFGLTEEQKFSYQHSVSMLNDGTIMLYDNGYSDERLSRIVKLRINQENKTIEKYEKYDLGTTTRSWGYVQAIDEENDVYLIDYGLGVHTEKSSIEEVNLKTGEIYFSFDFEGCHAYHVFKSN